MSAERSLAVFGGRLIAQALAGRRAATLQKGLMGLLNVRS
jgi:hypothetical protein